ncbi:MAG: helix-turn-helix domain-containing protein [Inhella sp.]
MKSRRITQDGLAEMLGVTQGAVQHWLSGSRQPDLAVIIDIADKIGVSRAWLLLGIDELSQVDDLPAWAAETLRPIIRDTRQGLLDAAWYAKLRTAIGLISPAVSPMQHDVAKATTPVPSYETADIVMAPIPRA